MHIVLGMGLLGPSVNICDVMGCRDDNTRLAFVEYSETAAVKASNV